jgi:hypothetical protein
VADIPAYVRALVPTTLTSDARVTNHRWERGQAVGYQAVLERGTAVLVDTNGRLVARCRCGNPLRPPVELVDPVYTGPRWAGFDPQVIIVVVPSPTPIYPPGGGTAPATTPPTTRGPTTTTTTFVNSEAEAVRRIREPFEECVRGISDSGGSFLSPADVETILASLRYTGTATDQRQGIWRVVITVPDQNVEAGNLIGGLATWDVNLATGEITPVDENANEVASSCPSLA